LFNYAGKPWLTQYWVRQVKEKAYGGVTPDLGYGGHDEDEGQMGGVSALMAMGLFAVQGTCGSDPIYDITSPIFDTVRIALDKKFYPGGEFRIITKNNSAANMYIQSATLNGLALDNCWFYHSQFAAGGTLELTLGPQPNMNWGIKQLPPSDSRPVPVINKKQIGLLTVSNLPGSYSLSSTTRVGLYLYDVRGRLIKTLVNGMQPEGDYRVRIPENLAPGRYVLSLRAGKLKVEKVIVLER
jgi:hypothetical protein